MRCLQAQTFKATEAALCILYGESRMKYTGWREKDFNVQLGWMRPTMSRMAGWKNSGKQPRACSSGLATAGRIQSHYHAPLHNLFSIKNHHGNTQGGAGTPARPTAAARAGSSPARARGRPRRAAASASRAAHHLGLGRIVVSEKEVEPTMLVMRA
jgi:hypothetical protein